MVAQQEFITQQELLRKAELLKALGHPERLAIVLLVSRKELCVKELVKELGISQPKVSQHVGLMKELGILSFKMLIEITHIRFHCLKKKLNHFATM